MRQDINVSVETGNLRLVDVSAIPIVEFEWNNVDNDYVVEDNYLIANITLPSYYQLTDLQNVGVRISIPTTPLYLPIKFRFLRRTNSSLETAVFNSQPNIYNNDLFSVVDENGSEIKASELWMLHDSTYLIRLNDNDVSIFSGSTSDFEVSNANFQNRDFLIKCVPSNHYRYPLQVLDLSVIFIQTLTILILSEY